MFCFDLGVPGDCSKSSIASCQRGNDRDSLRIGDVGDRNPHPFAGRLVPDQVVRRSPRDYCVNPCPVGDEFRRVGPDTEAL